MQQRPALIWLSFYTPGDPAAEPPTEDKHVGTAIVEAGEATEAFELAKRLGLHPGPHCAVMTQGLSQESVPFYRPFLNRLMDDAALLDAFGADGVLMLDRKTTLGDGLASARMDTRGMRGALPSEPPPARRPYESPALEESYPIVDTPFSEG